MSAAVSSPSSSSSSGVVVPTAEPEAVTLSALSTTAADASHESPRNSNMSRTSSSSTHDDGSASWDNIGSSIHATTTTTTNAPDNTDDDTHNNNNISNSRLLSSTPDPSVQEFIADYIKDEEGNVPSDMFQSSSTPLLPPTLAPTSVVVDTPQQQTLPVSTTLPSTDPNVDLAAAETDNDIVHAMEVLLDPFPMAGEQSGETPTKPSTTVSKEDSERAPLGIPLPDDERSVSEDRKQEDEQSSQAQPHIPLMSLRAGLRKKESAFYLQSWIAMSLTLDGRDKLTKSAQYASRMLAWWYLGRPQAQRFEALKVALTSSRKAYRLGRSVIEVQKLRQLGLLETIGWYLRQQAVPSVQSSETTTAVVSLPHRRTLLQKLHSILLHIYRPVASTVSYSGTACQPPSVPLWQLIGTALKMVGLCGFWASDNVSYLAQVGLLDNVQLTDASRLMQRQALSSRASIWANRCYFGGSVAGLLVSWRCYWRHRQQTLRALYEQQPQKNDSAVCDKDDSGALEKARAQQFVLFLAVLKGVCDVLVFSNNPGIDWWKRHTGRKMHEGVHCVCGLVSASTVVYNTFPDAVKK
jgi:hypothetical protein